MDPMKPEDLSHLSREALEMVKAMTQTEELSETLQGNAGDNVPGGSFTTDEDSFRRVLEPYGVDVIHLTMNVRGHVTTPALATFEHMLMSGVIEQDAIASIFFGMWLAGFQTGTQLQTNRVDDVNLEDKDLAEECCRMINRKRDAMKKGL